MWCPAVNQVFSIREAIWNRVDIQSPCALASGDTDGSGSDIVAKQDDQAPGDEPVAPLAGDGENICPKCAGSGLIGSAECAYCAGTGKVVEGIAGA